MRFLLTGTQIDCVNAVKLSGVNQAQQWCTRHLSGGKVGNSVTVPYIATRLLQDTSGENISILRSLCVAATHLYVPSTLGQVDCIYV